MAGDDRLDRYRGYLQDEADGAYYYRSLAELSEDEALRDLYLRIAETETRHLALWQEELRKAGQEAETPRPSRRARALMWVARRLGSDAVLPVIKAMESNAEATYAAEPVAAAAGLPADERSHFRLFQALSERPGGASGSAIARVESRHRAPGGGNALRAGVLGANDGLVSNLALVMGVAGADPGQATVLLAGAAGLLAGSFSMALGEWISVTSAREASQALLTQEAEEIAVMPEAEAEEIALIFEAKGLPREDAERFAQHIIADEDAALSLMAREELGLAPQDLGSPWTAAFTSLVLFTTGAAIPVLPFLFGMGPAVIAVSAVLSGLALFALGAAITLFTGRSWLFSGARQAVLGLAAAAVTFAIGSAIGSVAGI